MYADAITPHNRYGVKGGGTGTGTDTLKRYFPGYRFAKNVLVHGRADLYPPHNFFPKAMDDVGFVNLSGGNYRLSEDSPYRHGGLGGADIGADIDKIAAATGLPR